MADATSFALVFSRRFSKSLFTIFWDMTPCSPLKVNLRFGETYLLHPQGRISLVRYQREKSDKQLGLPDTFTLV
jgi:hypothetical protein